MPITWTICVVHMTSFLPGAELHNGNITQVQIVLICPALSPTSVFQVAYVASFPKSNFNLLVCCAPLQILSSRNPRIWMEGCLISQVLLYVYSRVPYSPNDRRWLKCSTHMSFVCSYDYWTTVFISVYHVLSSAHFSVHCFSLDWNAASIRMFLWSPHFSLVRTPLGPTHLPLLNTSCHTCCRINIRIFVKQLECFPFFKISGCRANWLQFGETKALQM